VPYRWLREQVDTRLTDTVLEVFAKGKRIASHVRSYDRGRHTTVVEHLPPKHQQYLGWSPERLASWAERIGHSVKLVVEQGCWLRSSDVRIGLALNLAYKNEHLNLSF